LAAARACALSLHDALPIYPAARALAVGLATLLVATACGGSETTSGPEYEGDTFDWRRYEGTSLKAYIADTGQVDALRENLDEFEDRKSTRLNSSHVKSSYA